MPFRCRTIQFQGKNRVSELERAIMRGLFTSRPHSVSELLLIGLAYLSDLQTVA